MIPRPRFAGYDDGRGPTLVAALTCVFVDTFAACRARLVVESVHDRAGEVEVAMLLWGDGPTPRQPGRIRDVEPLDSTSTAGDVEVEPEGLVKARDALLARHPGAGDRVVGIAHSHPGRQKPRRSRTDRDWHALCLDTCRRPDLVLRLGDVQEGWVAGDGDELQVFYSIVFPSTGRLDAATTYLVTRLHRGGDHADQDWEIDHLVTESVRARASVRDLHAVVARHGLFGTTIRFDAGLPAAVPAVPAEDRG